MKNKTYHKFIYFGMAVLFGIFSRDNIQATEIEEENTYIIMARSDWDYKTLINEYKDNINDNSNMLIEEEKMLVISADEAMVQELETDQRVNYIEEDIFVQGCANEDINEENNNLEWNLDAINLPSKETEQNSEKIKVAIIDSGIDYSNDIDVKERKNFIPDQDNISVLYEDSTGHGTCIAGIMAAKNNEIGITGINSNIELYSARVLDHENKAPVSRIIEAINWAIDKRVNILNLSFGTIVDSTALHNAIKKAYDNNILIIAAAGNTTQVEYPAAYEEAVAVGSIGTDGNVSEHSAIGNGMELVAPGEQILSTGAFDGVMTCGGTSMAVPHVVGVASLLWEKDTTVDAEFIRMVLDSGAKAYDDKSSYGYGLVDYKYAEGIYNDCKKAYDDMAYAEKTVEDLKEEGILEENESEIDAKEYKDVDYVEGLWTTVQHQTLAGQNSLSAVDMSILKLGAVANDSYIQGMTHNPQWHGYWKNPYTSQTTNYVACYLYISRIAKQYKEGNTSTVPQLSGMSISDYNNMRNIVTPTGVNGVSWGTLLGSGSLATNTYKGLFLYGMALHCATDIYSHSTNRLDGTSIKHKEISPNGIKAAHDQNYYSNRYTCAQIIASQVVSNYLYSSIGSVSDFFIPSYNGSFYLTNISNNIGTVDYSYYINNKSYFDRLNYSRDVSSDSDEDCN